jgi:hypothetical protein
VREWMALADSKRMLYGSSDESHFGTQLNSWDVIESRTFEDVATRFWRLTDVDFYFHAECSRFAMQGMGCNPNLGPRGSAHAGLNTPLLGALGSVIVGDEH